MRQATLAERLTYLNPALHHYLNQYDNGLRVDFNKGCTVWNHGYPIAQTSVNSIGAQLTEDRVIIKFDVHQTEYRDQDFKTYTKRLNRIMKVNGFEFELPVTPIDVDVDVDKAGRYFAVIVRK